MPNVCMYTHAHHKRTSSLYFICTPSSLCHHQHDTHTCSLQHDRLYVHSIVDTCNYNTPLNIRQPYGHRTHLSRKEQYVAQEYISKLLLLKGHKFDLRLYVVVTSLYPLVSRLVCAYLLYSSGVIGCRKKEWMTRYKHMFARNHF